MKGIRAPTLITMSTTDSSGSAAHDPADSRPFRLRRRNDGEVISEHCCLPNAYDRLWRLDAADVFGPTTVGADEDAVTEMVDAATGGIVAFSVAYAPDYDPALAFDETWFEPDNGVSPADRNPLGQEWQ